ncbi:C39 family peptidase [Paenibacillus thailandensis]|uniref:C39 family peptidase n=1 Tax=Paenibacillus thailandensis TaxID=393250 RepID=UPI00362678C6
MERVVFGKRGAGKRQYAGHCRRFAKESVYYSQEDARWRNLVYSNHRNKTQTIGTSGCGPTCMAMVISSMTEEAVLPHAAAEYAVNNGFRTKDNGTAWTFFGKIAASYGLKCKQTGSWEETKEALLQGGRMAIASMATGHFTSGGHYIVLWNMTESDGGRWIDVLDPNADNTRYGKDDLVDEGVKDDGKVKAKESLFLREARQYWIFSR